MHPNVENYLSECPGTVAAKLLGVSVGTLRNWRLAGRLKAKQGAGGRWLYDVRPLVLGRDAA